MAPNPKPLDDTARDCMIDYLQTRLTHESVNVKPLRGKNERYGFLSMLELKASNVNIFENQDVSGNGDANKNGTSSGIVLLLDRSYTGAVLQTLYQRLEEISKGSIAVVLYMGGGIFYRPVDNDSLKKRKIDPEDFSSFEIDRTRFLRPEEIFLQSRNGFVQYYRPETENQVEEALVTCRYVPLLSDGGGKGTSSGNDRDVKTRICVVEQIDVNYGPLMLPQGQKLLLPRITVQKQVVEKVDIWE